MTFHRSALVAAMLAAAAGAALAQSSPYYIGVAQTFTHEDNLVRLRDGQQLPAGLSKADTISSTALVAGLDQTFGRQRVFGNATLRTNRYQDNSDFNTQGYSASGGLQWQTIEQLSGSVRLGADRALRADVRDRNDAFILGKNDETSTTLDITAALGVAGPWSLEAGFNWRKVNYSAAAAQFREYDTKAGTFGVRWRPGATLSLGLGIGRSTVDYPLLLTTPDTNDHRASDSVDLSATWEASGASSVAAKVSRNKTKYSQFAERDFSATSGSLAWTWLPGARLRLTTRLSRDIGQDADRATTAFSRTTDALSVQAVYEISAKVSTTLVYNTYQRRIVGNGLFVTGISGTDKGDQATLSVRWAALRSLTVGCDYSHDQRRPATNPLLNDVYTANAYSCYGQFTLQ
jgi:hypothetical protein